MDDKKLRKISKKELLELLLSQAKRIEELESELLETKNKLNSKEIMIDEVGSLAEASLKLNGIFEVAQETANQYMFNIKEKCRKLEEDTNQKCLKREQEMNEYLIQVEENIKKLAEKKKKRYEKNTDKVGAKKKSKGKVEKRNKKGKLKHGKN